MKSLRSCLSGPRFAGVPAGFTPCFLTSALLFVSAAGFGADTAPRLATPAASPPLPVAGAQRDATSAAISADGRFVAFLSAAGNLAGPPAAGGMLDLWIRDRVAGATTRATADLFGQGGADADTGYAVLSPDGRYVAFESRARNLVTNAVSGNGDVFLRDLQTANTWLVSARPDGAGGDGPSRRPYLSADGRWVLFESDATDLVTNTVAANGVGNVYLFDRETGKTVLVSSQPITGVASTNQCRAAGLIFDGRYQLFGAATAELVRPPQSVTKTQAILHDRISGTNRYVALNPSGKPVPVVDARELRLSPGGDVLTFTSTDASLNAGGQSPGLFWRDLGDGTLTRIAGNATRPFGYYELSLDGRRVGFTQTNQVFVWDALARSNTLVSVTTNGTVAVGISRFAGMSDDGTQVVFISNASELVDGPASTGFQTYVRDLSTGVTTRLSARDDGTPAAGETHFASVSGDGRLAVFEGADTGLVEGLAPGVADVFARELPHGPVELISRAAPNGALPNAGLRPSFHTASQLSADGRLLLFSSDNDELVAGDVNHASDVFLRDLRTGITTLVSINATGTGSGSGPSTHPVMSADGRWIAFVSRATNLTAESAVPSGNVFLRDMVAGVTTLLSTNSTGQAAGRCGDFAPVISPAGAWVAFVATRADLVSGNTRVVAHETATGRLTAVLATVAASTPTSIRLLAVGDDARVIFYSKPNLFVRRPGDSLAQPISTAAALLPAASPDAHAVAFWGDINTTTYSLRLYDVSTRNNQPLLLDLPGLPSQTAEMAISDDARFVAFTHDGGGLNAADTNGARDVYLVDRNDTKVVELVSRNAAGTAAGNGASEHPRVSTDGRFVVFRSRATDLVRPPLTRAVPRLFVRDRQEGVTRLLTAEEGSPGLQPLVGGAPPLVAFASEAGDLVPGDYNAGLDLFTLALLPAPPLAVSVRLLASGEVELTWPDGGAPGYRVEFKPTLTAPAWQVLPVVIVSDPGGHHHAVDPGPIEGGERYYRVVALP